MSEPVDDDQTTEWEHYDPEADADDVESKGGDESSESETDSEDGDGGYDGQRKESVEDLLDRILAGIRDGTKDLTRDDHFASFATTDGDNLASLTGQPRQPTALHIMAAMEKKLLPKLDRKMEPLVKFLVRHHNNLLVVQDKSGHTPLYIAVEDKKEKMVRWMCEAHNNIDTILAITSTTDMMNCVHVGIEKRVKFLGLLVDEASTSTLAAKDRNGNTPLHLAVDYKKCRSNHLAIIEQIVAKSDDTIRQQSRDGDFNKAGLSPYLYHIKSVEAAKAKEKAKLEKEKEKEKEKNKDDKGREKDSSRNNPNSNPNPNPNNANPTPNPNPKPNDTTGPASRGTAAGQGKGGQTPAPTPSGQHKEPGSRPDRRQQANQGEFRSKYGGLVPGQTSSLPAQGPDDVRRATRKQTESTATRGGPTVAAESASSSKVDKATVAGVERFLKLHYLRSRSFDVATEVLYGRDTTSGVELFFDLFGRTSITRKGLGNLLKKLNFEDTLQYVAIPRISIEDDTGSNTPNSKRSRSGPVRSSKSPGDGRRDLCYIFKCLREKGVRTILKVIVDDSGAPAHSDEAIEEALNFMNVEVWNWKKTDLCSEVIYRVAPKARDVHLYWGGNNIVLRGWSEPEGLRRLKQLRTVHLHVQQGLESSDRTQRNVEEFDDRMKKVCPDVIVRKEFPNVKRRAQVAAAQTDGTQPEQHTTRHEWLQCMQDFHRLLIDAERSYERQNLSIEEPIKVAIIDDGVDVTDLEYYFIGGRSFCRRDEENNLSDAYYASRTGHGTIMAQQVHLLCPKAQFYVLRLEDHDSEEARQNGGGRQISARSAVRAIREAINKGVHIISTSWTIDTPEDETDRQDLEAAIVDAAKANILMFCSASDRGGGKQNATYPSKATPRIFTIGAASSSGSTEAWVGNLENISFTFPGSKVPLSRSTTKPGATSVVREATGSSVATALAAGLAALVLYCVQVRIMLAPNVGLEKEKARRDFEALKKHENMMKAFQDIGTTAESNHKFIEVWEVFGKQVEKKDHVDRDRWMELISDVGTTLCRKL